MYFLFICRGGFSVVFILYYELASNDNDVFFLQKLSASCNLFRGFTIIVDFVIIAFHLDIVFLHDFN